MAKRFKGNAPDHPYYKIGEVMANNKKWFVYSWDNDEWKNIKVFPEDRATGKANFWLTYNMEKNIFIPRHDQTLIEEHRPVVFEGLCKLLGVNN